MSDNQMNTAQQIFWYKRIGKISKYTGFNRNVVLNSIWEHAVIGANMFIVLCKLVLDFFPIFTKWKLDLDAQVVVTHFNVV